MAKFKKLKTKLRRKSRRYRSNPAPEREYHDNPAGLGEFAELAIPGVGGFVASRFLTRLASNTIAKKWPSKANHAGAASAIGAFLLVYFLGHKVKALAKYKTQTAVGAAIAAVQSLMELYLPEKLAWIVGNPSLASTTAAVQATQQQLAALAAPQQAALPDHLEEISEDPRWYTYNDAYDSGRHAATEKPAPGRPIDPVPEVTDLQDGDLELAQGVFSGGGVAGGF